MTHSDTELREIPPRFSYSVEYRTWQTMKQRCYNPKNEQYANYGGRGIKVCDEWINDAVAFYQHVGPRPSRKYSIDRINNDGDYEPGNVRWATYHEQMLNQRHPSRSGHRGINWNSQRLNWIARIKINNKFKNVGCFMTIDEALEAQRIATLQSQETQL